MSALAALLIVGIVPDEGSATRAVKMRRSHALCHRHRQRRLWRLAPLSSLGIGTSWSLQGLWAAPWLRDVDGLDRTGVVEILSVMAIVVSASGLALGLAATQVRRLGGKTEHVLLATIGLSLSAQLALVFELPVGRRPRLERDCRRRRPRPCSAMPSSPTTIRRKSLAGPTRP